MTELLEPELESKMATSETPGTEALFAPPELDAQFVLAVAAQVFADPPPTQNLLAIYMTPRAWALALVSAIS